MDPHEPICTTSVSSTTIYRNRLTLPFVCAVSADDEIKVALLSNVCNHKYKKAHHIHCQESVSVFLSVDTNTGLATRMHMDTTLPNVFSR